MRYIVSLLFFILFSIAGNTLSARSVPTTQQKDSIVKTYHDNGKVKNKIKFRNGKKHGRWATYDENGVLLKLVKYKKGVFWWERLYKKGKLSQFTDRKGKVIKMKDCGC